VPGDWDRSFPTNCLKGPDALLVLVLFTERFPQIGPACPPAFFPIFPPQKDSPMLHLEVFTIAWHPDNPSICLTLECESGTFFKPATHIIFFFFGIPSLRWIFFFPVGSSLNADVPPSPRSVFSHLTSVSPYSPPQPPFLIPPFLEICLRHLEEPAMGNANPTPFCLFGLPSLAVCSSHVYFHFGGLCQRSITNLFVPSCLTSRRIFATLKLAFSISLRFLECREIDPSPCLISLFLSIFPVPRRYPLVAKGAPFSLV